MKWKTCLCGSVSVLALGLLPMQAQAQSTDSTATSDDADLETVVVTGIRASMEKGLEVKRNAVQVVESIAAEDIGKFPDNNVVEALQRLSGVQVTDRGSGEVSTLAIRGMSDIETTWNGRKIFTSDSRYFSVQDMPATMVSRLDAYKTRGANMIESGIGGVIDIKTHHPFDFDGLKFSMQYRETYQEKAGAFDPNVSMLLSDSWNTGIGKVGALINLSYHTIHYRDESATAGAMVPFLSENLYDAESGTQMLYAGQRLYSSYSTGLLSYYSPSYVVQTDDGSNLSIQKTVWTPGLVNGLSESSDAALTATKYVSHGSSTTTDYTISIPYVLSRDAVFLTDNKGKTARPNLSVAFQWQPDDNQLYTFEFMYNGYRNYNDDSMLFSYVDWWTPFNTGGDMDGEFLDSITTYDGTNVVKTRHVEDVYGFNSGDYTKSKTNSFVYGAHGLWTINDRFTMDGDFAYQYSKYDTSFFALRIWRTASDIYVDYNEQGGELAFTFDDTDNDGLTDASTWSTGTLYDNASYTKGDAYTLSLDGVYDVNGMAGPLKKISFGVRLDFRGAKAGERTASGTNSSYSLAKLAETIPGLVTTNSKFFKGVSDVPRSWVNSSGRTMWKNRALLRELWGGNLTSTVRHTMFEDFNIDETNTAGYLMADLEQDVFGNPLTLNAGFRWVGIKDKTKSYNFDTYIATATLGEVVETKDNTYTAALLPSVTLSYSPLDSLKFRFNFGETIRNPSFDDLNPTRTLSGDVTKIGYGTGSSGNADLKPTKSKNYDLTAEWYFAPNSAFYTTFFRRDIKNLVVTLNQSLYIEGDDVEDEYNTNQFIISKPVNASKGFLKGIEIGTTYFPDYLPGWLDGLGFQGSLTFLGSGQNVPEANDLGTVTNQLHQSFYGISSVSYNTTLVYEHGGFSSRISYVWRSHFHDSDESASFANPLGLWRRGESSLDMSAGYRLDEGVEFTFDATNMLNAKQKTYYFNNGNGNKNRSNYGTTLLTRTFSLGFRFATN